MLKAIAMRWSPWQAMAARSRPLPIFYYVL
jgi:hypothetical protein